MNNKQNNLKMLRIKKGLLQKDVAKLLGFSSADRICRWEKGQTVPNVKNFLKLCELYQISPSDIYQSTDFFSQPELNPNTSLSPDKERFN